MSYAREQEKGKRPTPSTPKAKKALKGKSKKK